MPNAGAIYSGAVIAMLAATPAHSQSDNSTTNSARLGAFELESDFDAGLVAAAGDSFGRFSGLFADLDARIQAEAITDAGVRWGAVVRLRAQADHGRNGFDGQAGSCLATGPGSDCHGFGARSLATGRYNSVETGSPDRIQAAAEAAYGYVRFGWGEIRAGRTQGAAALDQPLPPSAFRLVNAGGGPIDPTGLEAGLARNSLSGFSTRVLVRSERVLGLRAALSYTGQSEGCGVDYCVHETTDGTVTPPVGAPVPVRLQGNTLNSVIEAGVSFDHTFRDAGRVELGAGLLLAEPDRAAPGSDDVRSWSVSGRWTFEDWSAGFSHLDVRQTAGQAYQATAAAISLDRGDWRFAAEGALSSDDFLHEESRLVQIGASRLVGDHALIGAGVRTIDTDGALSTAGGRVQVRRSATSFFVELGVRY
ncbi:porin [Hyphobacterium marinum]|uniref:Porin n=1 Tax=Hyphobacterium marinum TaxID=3116574 RepID=A0ABU7LUX3_9PROT|nr:porin [Hyphobacterium sp. Y6023]MEE2565357.1 porin [Hyphobacterium sp. Y6023]